jgi:hypothetical protein
MSIKVADDKSPPVDRSIIDNYVRDLVDSVLNNKDVPKYKVRREDPLSDAYVLTSDILRKAVGSNRLSTKLLLLEDATKLLVKTLSTLKTHQERMKGAKEEVLFGISPSTRGRDVPAFVFEDGTVVLESGGDAKIASESEPIDTDFYGPERFFRVRSDGEGWRARCINYLAHTYPKNKEYKSYLVDAEVRYASSLKPSVRNKKELKVTLDSPFRADRSRRGPVF